MDHSLSKLVQEAITGPGGAIDLPKLANAIDMVMEVVNLAQLEDEWSQAFPPDVVASTFDDLAYTFSVIKNQDKANACHRIADSLRGR